MKLLGKIQLGGVNLKNRLAMAAMTRGRTDSNGVVGDMTVTYYAQRAGAGLIFSEAIRISEEATGSPFTPGIFTDEQIAAWKKVTTAVHDQGGVIIAQLWHTGRMGHSIDRNGKLPLAPSALPILGMQHFTSQGRKDFEIPRQMTIADIRQTILDYGQAAKNAIAAGFDGVTLHACNGYLPNQFLAESSNQGIPKLISFGRLYIANPDLLERFEKNGPLIEPDRATMYGGGRQGYIDYPMWNNQP
jgi:N-ethylmaleimide reductase